jgi:Concanavalin A-like lectin/glucanases superfamily
VKTSLRRNIGALFVISFILLLMVSAAELGLGLAGLANETATLSFYLLIVGVGIQVFSSARRVTQPEPQAVAKKANMRRLIEDRFRRQRILATVVVVALAASAPLTLVLSNHQASGGVNTAFSTQTSIPANTTHGSATNLAGIAVSNGLVGYWPCNEATSGNIATLVDQTGNGNNGTPVNGPSYVEGLSKGACDFRSGESQYVALPSTQAGFPMGDSPRSFFAWVRTTDATDVQVIFSYGVTAGSQLVLFDINQATPGSVYFSADGNDCFITNSNIEDGNWHHVGFTYSGNRNLILYVDGIGTTCGISRNLNTVAGSIANIASSYGLGNPNYLDGQLSGIRLYDRALSVPEVLAIHLAQD